MAHHFTLRCLLSCLGLGLALQAAGVWADEPVLRTSAQMVFKDPSLTQAGRCVAYREGGSGWIITDPVYYVKGRVLSSEIKTRTLGVCPETPGKTMEHYSREEFVRLAVAQPCVSRKELAREAQVGTVRFRVDDWETPHARRAANAGRLFQGHFLATRLSKGVELELEADLLTACQE